jgi:hypothetical protein
MATASHHWHEKQFYFAQVKYGSPARCYGACLPVRMHGNVAVGATGCDLV